MGTTIEYEWDMETIDLSHNTGEDGETDHDIISHDHADKLADLPWLLEPDQRLVLVRDDNRPSGVRSWAYLDPESKMLPKYFTDAYGEETAKVPQCFHREVAKVASGH